MKRRDRKRADNLYKIYLMVVAFAAIALLTYGLLTRQKTPAARPSAEVPAAASAPAEGDWASEEAQIAGGQIMRLFPVDGDSVDAPNGQKMRLNCIDAPEYDQAGGAQATQHLGHLIRRGVRVRRVGWDNYNRALVILLPPKGKKEPINLQMVRQGHAWVFGGAGSNCGIDRAALCEAESEARQARRGLWGKRRPVPPYLWRKKGRRAGGRFTSACER